jgi:predicted small lipoprotein YifL
MRSAALLVFLLLTACGQSGDLYLPPDPPVPSEAAEPAAPATDDAEKKKKE